jgi:hypothetical protein
MRPVQASAGEQLHVTAVDAGVHAVAVEFYFVDPAGTGRRFFDKARQLRLDPFWRPIGFFHDG